MGPTALRVKKTYTDKNKLNAAKAMGPIDFHYMTDRLQRFELQIFVCVLLKKESLLHLGCPGGKQIDIKFSFLGRTIPLTLWLCCIFKTLFERFDNRQLVNRHTEVAHFTLKQPCSKIYDISRQGRVHRFGLSISYFRVFGHFNQS